MNQEDISNTIQPREFSMDFFNPITLVMLFVFYMLFLSIFLLLKPKFIMLPNENGEFKLSLFRIRITSFLSALVLYYLLYLF